MIILIDHIQCIFLLYTLLFSIKLKVSSTNWKNEYWFCISAIETSKPGRSGNGHGKKITIIIVGVIAGIAVVVAVVFFILYLRYVSYQCVHINLFSLCLIMLSLLSFLKEHHHHVTIACVTTAVNLQMRLNLTMSELRPHHLHQSGQDWQVCPV